jgi:predicted ester cyclase
MEIQVRFADVLDLTNGKVAAFRRYFDTVTMLRQLGLVAGTPLHAPDRRAPLELYAQPVDTNAPQRHKAIVHRFLQEVFDRRNAAAAADSCAKGYLWHGGHLGDATSLHDYQAVITSFFVGFPDLEVEVLDTIAEGDRVAVRFTMNGTHLGPFKGISPTYSRISGSGASTFRIAEGRIVEEWWQGDLLALLRQLEAKPAPDGTV